MMLIPVIKGRTKRVLLALIEQLTPRNTELDLDVSGTLLFHIEKMVREYPLLLRVGLCLGLWLFNFVPLFRLFSFKTFLALTERQKRTFVQQVSVSDFMPLREFMKAVRCLVYVGFFSDPRVWHYMGYQPHAHVEERIRLRQSLVSGDASTISPSEVFS